MADNKLGEGNGTFTTRIDMNAFAALINELRNNFAHEGDYHSFHFAYSDHTVINSLNVPETKEEWRMKNNRDIEKLCRVYDINLNYNEFKAFCVRGFVEFTKRYLESTVDKCL